MFLHLSVILFTGGSAQCMLGYHTPRTRHPPGTRHPHPLTRHPHPRPGTPLQCMLGDTVNKLAVCILLECNLVSFILLVALPKKPLLVFGGICLFIINEWAPLCDGDGSVNRPRISRCNYP